MALAGIISGETMLPAAVTPAPTPAPTPARTPARKARAKAPKPVPPGRFRRRYTSDEICAQAAGLTHDEKKAHVANVEARGNWPLAIRGLKNGALTNIHNTGAIDHLSDDDRRDVLLARQIVNNQKTSRVFNRKLKRQADAVAGLEREIKHLKRSRTTQSPPSPPPVTTGLVDFVLDSLPTPQEVDAVPAVSPVDAPGTVNLTAPSPLPPPCDDDDDALPDLSL